MRSFLTVSASLGGGAMVRTLLEIKGEKMLFVLTHHLTNLCHQKCGGDISSPVVKQSFLQLFQWAPACPLIQYDSDTIYAGDRL